MRILDLGMHDGYVSIWLARNFPHIDQIDGVELNSDAVEIAQRRLDEAGIVGDVVQDYAENAHKHFMEESYDAVVCFELIEHVPDVDYFLTQIERMVKPGGRVYISTPDGTFGLGNNPHHLRAYRSIDLAEVLRRRGTLEQMAVGDDGITFASYTPTQDVEQKGEVAIFTGGAWKPWSPYDIESPGGLGGSETAAVRLAQAMSAQGYVVTVYGDVAQGCFQNVVYRHYSTFDPLEKRDAVIVSRLPEMFDRPINARSRILWMHDTDYADRMTPQRVAGMTDIMTLSAWHAENVMNLYPFTYDKIRITSNGIIPAYFRGPAPDRGNRVIYSSSPDRGLDLVLEAWSRVREAVPDAELVHCYSDVYDAVAAQNPVVGKFHQDVLRLSEQPGVRRLGGLSQPVLANEMRQSKVWVAPSFCTPYNVPFHETYCIGAVESAAAGCFRVGAPWGALKERKLDHYIKADKDHRPTIHSIAQGIIKGLKAKRQPIHAWAKECTWVKVGDDFDGIIQNSGVQELVFGDMAFVSG